MITRFSVPYFHHLLQGDHYHTIAPGGPYLLLLHGAGASQRKRFSPLREILLQSGIASSSFDFVGHGDTGGGLQQSSLAARTEQALAILKSLPARSGKPVAVLGASMGAYNAVKLTQYIKIDTLILVVPAVYDTRAHQIPFGPDFSVTIRSEKSWKDSDVWRIMRQFKGKLLLVTAGQDAVVPAEIPNQLASSALNARQVVNFTFKASQHKIFDYLKDRPDQLYVLANVVRKIIRS